MKALRFLKWLAITAAVVFVFIIIAGFILVFSYAEYDENEQSKVLLGYNDISSVFYSDNKTGNESVYEMNVFVSRLPAPVVTAFLDEWVVIVADEMPLILSEKAISEKGSEAVAIMQSPGGVGGYSNWRMRTMYVRDYSDDEITYRVFIHELGHYFDYEFGSPSYTDAFQKIFIQHMKTFEERDETAPAGYAVSSAQEFFAAVFKEYFLYPEHLKSVAPDAYDYFDSLYRKVINNNEASTTLKYDLRSALTLLRVKTRTIINKLTKE